MQELGRGGMNERFTLVLDVACAGGGPGARPALRLPTGLGRPRGHRRRVGDAGRAAAPGRVRVCRLLGPDCEHVHDAFDMADLDWRPDGPWAMITWHTDDPLAEAAWFALYCAWPDAAFEDSCGSVVGISVGSPAWATELRAAFADPGAFSARYLNDTPPSQMTAGSVPARDHPPPGHGSVPLRPPRRHHLRHRLGPVGGRQPGHLGHPRPGRHRHALGRHRHRRRYGYDRPVRRPAGRRVEPDPVGFRPPGHRQRGRFGRVRLDRLGFRVRPPGRFEVRRVEAGGLGDPGRQPLRRRTRPRPTAPARPAVRVRSAEPAGPTGGGNVSRSPGRRSGPPGPPPGGGW